MDREIMLLTAYFEHSVGFRREMHVKLMHDVCFLMRDGELPFILEGGFQSPA